MRTYKSGDDAAKLIRLTFVCLSCLILAFGITACKSSKPSFRGEAGGQLRIYYIDVGQGDSELIRLPTGEDILIDSGDHGSHIVEKLRALGVKKLTLAVATHPHADHIGEMRNVLAAFPTGEFWDSGFPHTIRTYERLLEEIKRQGIKYAQPKAGTTRTFGQVLIDVLHPENGPPLNSNPNDASIVLRLSYGNRKFLFTGDAETPSWEQMFKRHRDHLAADVLKAAHHGSSNGTQSGVLVNVHPSIVTVSCAAGNSYHHPHPSVVKLLKASSDRIKFYRTDLDGTIQITSNGQDLNVQAEKQPPQDQIYLNGDETAAALGVAVRGGGRGGR